LDARNPSASCKKRKLKRLLRRSRDPCNKVASGDKSLAVYGPRQAAYDLKKLRGQQIVRRIGSTRRYGVVPSGLRAITALLVLREKAIKPLLAAAQDITPTRGGQNPRAIDRHYQDLRLAMKGVFAELGIAA
jgi:hypothetical protein